MRADHGCAGNGRGDPVGLAGDDRGREGNGLDPIEGQGGLGAPHEHRDRADVREVGATAGQGHEVDEPRLAVLVMVLDARGQLAHTGKVQRWGRGITCSAKPLAGQEYDLGPHNVRDRSRWGIVELKTLKGQNYTPEDLGNGVVTDKAIWQIQKTI